MELTAKDDDDGRRLDRILRKSLPGLPLSAIHRLVRTETIRVNGKAASASQKISSGDRIFLPDLADTGAEREAGPRKRPNRREKTPEAVFEGAGLLIVNKPAGIPVHGPRSLLELLRPELSAKTSPSLSFAPGPLHRLDTPTSGLVAFSLSLEGARYMSAALREGRVRKYYVAIVEGVITGNEFWEDTLARDHKLKKTFPVGGPGDGKAAMTRVYPLARNGGGVGHTLVFLEIMSGRTHQIRGQAALRGHPLAGDKKYGGGGNGGLFLHALALRFPSGRPEALPETLVVSPPEKFLRKIDALFGYAFDAEALVRRWTASAPGLGENYRG